MNRKKQSRKIIIHTVTRLVVGLILICGGIFGGLILISEGAQYIEDDGSWLIGALHGLYVIIFLWIIYLGVALLRNKKGAASQVKWIFILQSPIIAIPSLFAWDWSTGLKSVFIYEQAFGWSIDSLISVPEFHFHFIPSDFSIGLNLASLVLAWVAYRLQVYDINSIESQNISNEENVFSLLMRLLKDPLIKRKIWLLIGVCFIVAVVFYAKEKNESSQPTLVLDSREWMRCSLGQTWEGNTCAGVAKEFTFDEAQAALKELNAKGGAHGKTDWRVPTPPELASLMAGKVEQGKAAWMLLGRAEGQAEGKVENLWSSMPASMQDDYLNNLFYSGQAGYVSLNLEKPSANSFGKFWSSSPLVGHSLFAWVVDFSNGYVIDGNRVNNGHVRLVRASQ